MYIWEDTLSFKQGDIPPEAQGKDPSPKKIRTDYVSYGAWCYGNTIDLQRPEGGRCSYTIYQEFNGTERSITNATNPTRYTPYYDTDYNKQYPRFRVKAWLSNNNDFSPQDLEVHKMTAVMASLWEVKNDRLTHEELTNHPTDPYMQQPYPPNFWFIENGKITHSKLPEPKIFGTIYGDYKLVEVRIPQSVKTISNYAFWGTKLKYAKIASDCTYGAYSFPTDCDVDTYA